MNDRFSWQTHSLPNCGIELETPQNFTTSEHEQDIIDMHIVNIESTKPYVNILVECGKIGEKFSGIFDRDINLLKNQSVGYDQYILPINDTIIKIGENITSGSFRFANGEDAHTGVVTENQYYLFYLHQTYILLKIDVLDNDSYFVKHNLKGTILDSLKFLN